MAFRCRSGWLNGFGNHPRQVIAAWSDREQGPRQYLAAFLITSRTSSTACLQPPTRRYRPKVLRGDAESRCSLIIGDLGRARIACAGYVCPALLALLMPRVESIAYSAASGGFEIIDYRRACRGATAQTLLMPSLLVLLRQRSADAAGCNASNARTAR